MYRICADAPGDAFELEIYRGRAVHPARRNPGAAPPGLRPFKTRHRRTAAREFTDLRSQLGIERREHEIVLAGAPIVRTQAVRQQRVPPSRHFTSTPRRAMPMHGPRRRRVRAHQQEVRLARPAMQPGVGLQPLEQAAALGHDQPRLAVQHVEMLQRHLAATWFSVPML